MATCAQGFPRGTSDPVKMVSMMDELKRVFRDEKIAEIDMDRVSWRSGEWATPCMCGHHSHGYSGHCEHMCCDTDDCECGGFEPQPGMALPPRRDNGHFWRLMATNRAWR